MLLNELFNNPMNSNGSLMYSLPAIIQKRTRAIENPEEDVPVHIQWEKLERITGEKLNDLNTLCSQHFHIDPNNPTPKDVERIEIVLNSIGTLLDNIRETFHIEDEENNPHVVDNSQENNPTTVFRPIDVLAMKLK